MNWTHNLKPVQQSWGIYAALNCFPISSHLKLNDNENIWNCSHIDYKLSTLYFSLFLHSGDSIPNFSRIVDVSSLSSYMGRNFLDLQITSDKLWLFDDFRWFADVTAVLIDLLWTHLDNSTDARWWFQSLSLTSESELIRRFKKWV